MIIKTNFSIPERFAAYARGPFVLVRPEHANDAGLIAHEKVHVRQWLRTFGLHPLLYAVSKSYRLKAEVEAYREQLKYAPAMVDVFAGYLSSNYGLDISADYAALLIRLPGE